MGRKGSWRGDAATPHTQSGTVGTDRTRSIGWAGGQCRALDPVDWRSTGWLAEDCGSPMILHVCSMHLILGLIHRTHFLSNARVLLHLLHSSCVAIPARFGNEPNLIGRLTNPDPNHLSCDWILKSSSSVVHMPIGKSSCPNLCWHPGPKHLNPSCATHSHDLAVPEITSCVPLLCTCRHQPSSTV